MPRFARPFVTLLIAAMIATAVFAWEPWPLTSFRLFSHVRTDEQTGWVARTVEGDGFEGAYPIGAQELGFRGFGFVMAEFVDASDERQDELCRTWVRAAPELIGVEATQVRLYQRHWELSEREDDRALPGDEDLVYVCDGEGLVSGD